MDTKDNGDTEDTYDAGLIRKILNTTYLSILGRNRRPRLQETESAFPHGLVFDNAYPEIREEALSLIKKGGTIRYADIDPDRAGQVSKDWQLGPLMTLGQRTENLDQCPTIRRLINDIPNIINIYVSVLEPGVCLAAHSGPYAGFLRYHLGLVVPKKNPPSIRVDNEFYEWSEGCSIVIDDFFEHEVFNKATEQRVILIVDFLRDFTFPLNWINRKVVELMRKSVHQNQVNKS